MFYIPRLINNSLQHAISKTIARDGYDKITNMRNFSHENLVQAKEHFKSHIHDVNSRLNMKKRQGKVQNYLRKRLRFAFSSTMIPRETKVLIKENVQQQSNVIQVKAQSQQLLFIDSSTLQSHIKMEQLRHKIRTINNTKKTVSTQSSSSMITNNQGSIKDQNQNQVKNRFQELDRKAISITECNEYLSRGEFQQYKDYPVVKLTQICLRLIKEHKNVSEQRKQDNGKNNKQGLYQNRTIQQHWRQLQYYIRKRMHNCSVKDYMRIFYITQHSYKQIYKFSHNFIDALIKGLKQQIPLLEENQLMQLYLILSQNQLQGRCQYELGLRHARKYQNEQKVKSSFYEHEMLYKLQEQIVEKIIKKYQKKYMRTQLSLKEEDLIKIAWWLKSILLYQNSKFSLIKNNGMGNEKKNQYVVGLVNVLLGKHVKVGEENAKKNQSKNGSQGLRRLSSRQENQENKIIGNNNSGDLLKLQNKSVGLSCVQQVIQFLSNLSLVRDYLKIESQAENPITAKSTKDSNSSNNDIMLDKKAVWLQKSHGVNEVIEIIINYDNVQRIISDLFKHDEITTIDEHQQEKQQYNQQKLDQSNKKTSNKCLQLQTAHNRLQLLRLISSSKQYEKKPKSVHQWCSQLVNNYNIFLLLQQSSDLLMNNKEHQQQMSKQFYSVQGSKRLNMFECQLHILYMLYNNVYYANKLNNNTSRKSEQKDNNYGIEKLWQCYQQIISCSLNNKQDDQLISLPSPQSILKIINIQLSFNQIIKQSQKQSKYLNYSQQQDYPAMQLIKKYAQNILFEKNNCVNNIGSIMSYYVRELQLPLYTYLTCQIKHKPFNMSRQLQTDVLNILHAMKTRNRNAKLYLSQQNIQYQSTINNHQNPFTNFNPFHSLPQHNNNSLSVINNKNKHSSFSKQTVLLGQYMMMCLDKERKELLRNEQIVKVTKFFTEIKAFNELKFCHPVSDFIVTAQFLFSMNDNNKKVKKVDMISPKVLIFLSPEQLIKPQIMAEKIIYQASGLQMIIIDRRQFLNMHINQRIQKLNQLLFQKSTQNPLRYLLTK